MTMMKDTDETPYCDNLKAYPLKVWQSQSLPPYCDSPKLTIQFMHKHSSTFIIEYKNVILQYSGTSWVLKLNIEYWGINITIIQEYN